MANPAEGHTGRRLPAFLADAAPPLHQRLADDLRAHPGSLTADVARRLGITVLDASRGLGYARDHKGTVYGVRVGNGYRWACTGDVFDAAPRTPTEGEAAAMARGRASVAALSRARQAAVLALLDRPRSLGWLAGELRWPRLRVAHVLDLLTEQGRARNVEGPGVPGRWIQRKEQR